MPLEATDIEKLLPHRYPFLLVDRVLEFEESKWIRAIKNVSVNEPHFQGHFQGNPIMPGVLVIEALAQLCGILGKLSDESLRSKTKMYLAGVSKARFKRQVIPGDVLTLEAEFVRTRQNVSQMSCKALVEGELACSAELLVALEA